MICHRYTINVSADVMSAKHGMASPQNRLYIPNKGILAYGFYKESEVDHFSDEKEAIEDAKQIIQGKPLKSKVMINPNPKYLGEIDLPEDKINELIESYQAKEKADDDFKEKANSLISLLN